MKVNVSKNDAGGQNGKKFVVATAWYFYHFDDLVDFVKSAAQWVPNAPVIAAVARHFGTKPRAVKTLIEVEMGHVILTSDQIVGRVDDPGNTYIAKIDRAVDLRRGWMQRYEVKQANGTMSVREVYYSDMTSKWYKLPEGPKQ